MLGVRSVTTLTLFLGEREIIMASRTLKSATSKKVDEGKVKNSEETTVIKENTEENTGIDKNTKEFSGIDKNTSDTSSTIETAKVVAAVVAETINKMNDEKPTKKNKNDGGFDEQDLIVCRSVTEGELYLGGKNSGMLYVWSGYGDTREVEFRDLKALLYANSNYLKRPLIVIDNDELLELPRWRELKPLYEKLFGLENMNVIFNKNNEKFRETLEMLPDGLKNSVKVAAAERIENGELESLTKIKILDEVLGTDLVATFVK